MTLKIKNWKFIFIFRLKYGQFLDSNSAAPGYIFVCPAKIKPPEYCIRIFRAWILLKEIDGQWSNPLVRPVRPNELGFSKKLIS